MDVTDRTPAEEPAGPLPSADEHASGRRALAFRAEDTGRRLLLIFAPSVQDPGFRRQKELLDDAGDGLAFRDVLVVEVIGSQLVAAGGHTVAPEEAGRLRARWRAAPDVLTVVLASADGTERLRANQPMSAGPLIATIDGQASGRDAPDHAPGN